MNTDETTGRRLTSDNLRGVWAAIATPFDDRNRFDPGVLRENVRRLAHAGVHGIYTTDTDGEFYAIELEEFKQIIDVFADEAHRLGIPTQVGVTWSNTQGMVDRLRHAADRGILGAHVGHPAFMPMTHDSYLNFWQEISRAVPEAFGLVHYNTPRCPNYLRGADYAELQREVPNLIGSKHAGTSFPEFLELITAVPHLSHFAGESCFTPYSMFGARGIYSWFVNYNPRYMIDWYDDLAAHRWDQAIFRQGRMHAFMRVRTEVLQADGNLHGIVGKAVSTASPFLVPAGWTRRPYLPIAPDAVERFRRTVEEQFPDLVWSG